MIVDAHISKISGELSADAKGVRAVAALLEEGGTVPFIARYRKEATGSLDEVAVTSIRDRLSQLAELDDRRAAILKSLEEGGHLSDDLEARVMAAETLTELEDLYLPYRPKRRTRASVAREKGLEPLAECIFQQGEADPEAEALAFIDPEKGVESGEDALAGARDIVAEWINESSEARAQMRQCFETQGVFRSGVIPGKEEEGAKYRDYFDWEEPAASAPSHRILAMRRGEREGILSLRVTPDETRAVELLEGIFVKGSGPASEQVRLAAHDGYKRLLGPAMETEIRLTTRQRADAEAIRIFSENLRQLLLSPPLGQKNVLAIDPGFRTGCKLVCLDRQGRLLHTDTVFPGQGKARDAEARKVLTECCSRFEAEAIAIGNGTGGRELEAFIRGLDLPEGIPIVMVAESGASVYSASAVAREEFPEQDLTVRGAVSIGRRLMDPLAELVKIDPKSIGVGQYQHDVDQAALKTGLDEVVMISVNAVGVDVNTASKQILTYISGLGPQVAGNIVEHRNQNGPFDSRKSLKEVSRLGPKAYEQAAGFLRIAGGDNTLDASAVHPESYTTVEQMAADVGCTVNDLMRDEALRKRINLNDYISDTVGLPTLNDIIEELARPGRDPRDPFEVFQFAENIQTLEDLKPGMSLPGVVTNITAFGAFVDIGVHTDGLVHVSQLADRFVKDPADVVKMHQKVTVRVLEIDLQRKRISLSMKKAPDPERPPTAARPERGSSPAPKRRKKSPPKPTASTPDSALADALKRAGLG